MIIPPSTGSRAAREIALVVRPGVGGVVWFNRVNSELRSAGLCIHCFGNAQEAILRVEQGGLAGAVLFPDKTGPEGLSLMKIIRSIDGRLPCWLVLEETSRRALQTAFDLRVTGVMTHPVEPAEFSFTLTRTLGGQGSPDAIRCSAALDFTQERSDFNDG